VNPGVLATIPNNAEIPRFERDGEPQNSHEGPDDTLKGGGQCASVWATRIAKVTRPSARVTESTDTVAR
jgi:hypothetical protein